MSQFPSIPGYTIQRLLGKNATAAVFLATHEDSGQHVALKVLCLDVAQEKSQGERFLREAKIVARLKHPHIVAVNDIGHAGNCYYLVMEYLPGASLSEQIKQGLKAGQILRIAKQIASALDAAHQQAYIHRDVAPDNILFRADGSAVLTDFGIAKPIQELQVSAERTRYSNPEKIRGEAVGASSDWYSFGIVLYEMLTGAVPFNGADSATLEKQHLHDAIPRLTGAKVVFQRLIDGLLAKNKADRIQEGKQVLEALEVIHAALRRSTSGTSSATKPAAKPPAEILTAQQAALPEKTIVEDDAIRADSSDRPVVAPPSESSDKKQTPMFAMAIVVLLLLFLAGVFFAPQIAPKSPLMTLHVLVKEQISPTPKVDLKQEKIEHWLSMAEQAMQIQHYVQPLSGSALEAYREVLVLDDLHDKAKAGLEHIAAILIKSAEAEIEAQNFEVANNLLKQAKSVSSHAVGLLSTETLLRRKQQEAQDAANQRLIEQQRQAEEQAQKEALEKQRALVQEQERQQRLKAQRDAEAAKQQELAKQKAESEAAAAMFTNIRIRGLLAKAANHYARGEYFAPTAENALEVYASVLQLDADNQEAKDGVKQAVEKVVEQLEKLVQEQRINEAQALYSFALLHSNNDPALFAFAQRAGW